MTRPAGNGVEIHTIEEHRDERGFVFEPVGAESLRRQRNVHVVWTEPGCVRGNHVHRHATEVLVVRGPALVRYREADVARDVVVRPGEVVGFTIPPDVPHAILNTGTEPNLLVAFRDREHDTSAPDSERVILLEGNA